MQRLSRKFWVRFFAIAVLVLYTDAAYALSQESQDAKTSAENMGSIIQNKLGSESSMNQNMFKPMTGGGDMSTFDDKTHFQANLTCPSSKKYLEIMIQPGGTGDITYMTVWQDINMDGVQDAYYTPLSPEVRISGVCANGFISCDAGTWNNCKHYLWTTEPFSGTLSYTQGSLVNLYSCYCINVSCGSNLVWTNLSKVLEDLGGGIVGALQLNNPATSVSKADLTSTVYGTSITFYGQKSGNCNAATGGAGTSTPYTFYDNPQGLEPSAQAIVSSQKSDPNSYYNLVINAGNSTSNRRSCTIARSGEVKKDTQSIDGNGGPGNLCTDHLVFIRAELKTEADGNKHVLLLMVDTDPGGTVMHWNCGGDPNFPGRYGGWHVIQDVDIPDDMDVTNVVYCVNNLYGGGCTTSSPPGVTSCTSFAGQSVQVGMYCPSGGAQSITFSWSYSIQGAREYFTNTIVNNCTVLENDPDCKLDKEIVDGVVTVENGSPTGLQPQPSCRVFGGVTKATEVCYDWWEKRRIYICNTQQQSFDFSKAKERMNSVLTSVEDHDSYMTYIDRRWEDGTWKQSQNTVFLYSPRDSYSSCSMGCKVKKGITNTQVAQSGPTTTQLSSTYSNEFYYRECVSKGSTYECPVNSDESIVTPCTCINEFNQAAVGMQMLRLAGQDLICSDGVPKPL